MPLARQRTIHNRINCTGIGLHSGETVRMCLRPAPADAGIVFCRTDAEPGTGDIPARFDKVTETDLGTTISNEHGILVATVEHLLSALAGCQIDNVIVEVDGAEVPIMDGSAAPFVFLLDCAGVTVQDAPRRFIRILKSVSVEENDKRVEISPHDGFRVDFEIEFDTAVIAYQSVSIEVDGSTFRSEICRARTFGFAPQVDHLRSRGLTRGGSLDNAIVIDGDEILNDGGLRYQDEFVRHKALDAVGDMYLAGGTIQGVYRGVRAGHGLNNRLLRALFADETAWEWTSIEEAVVEVPEVEEMALVAAI